MAQWTYLSKELSFFYHNSNRFQGCTPTMVPYLFQTFPFYVSSISNKQSSQNATFLISTNQQLYLISNLVFRSTKIIYPGLRSTENQPTLEIRTNIFLTNFFTKFLVITVFFCGHSLFSCKMIIFRKQVTVFYSGSLTKEVPLQYQWSTILQLLGCNLVCI